IPRPAPSDRYEFLAKYSFTPPIASIGPCENPNPSPTISNRSGASAYATAAPTGTSVPIAVARRPPLIARRTPPHAKTPPPHTDGADQRRSDDVIDRSVGMAAPRERAEPERQLAAIEHLRAVERQVATRIDRGPKFVLRERRPNRDTNEHQGQAWHAILRRG